MTAWQRLLAASSLAIGTAWDLITHPKTGGAGTVVSNGATIALADASLTAALDESAFAVALETAGFAVAVTSAQITVSVAPDITAQITPTQIGATT